MRETVPAREPLEAWLFCGDDLQMRFPPWEPIVAGVLYRAEPPVELRWEGLMPSRDAIDALDLALGPTACRCAAWGEVVSARGFFRAECCRILWMADARDALRGFARECSPGYCENRIISPECHARMAVRLAMLGVQKKQASARRAALNGVLQDALLALCPELVPAWR